MIEFLSVVIVCATPLYATVCAHLSRSDEDFERLVLLPFAVSDLFDGASDGVEAL